MDGRLDKGQRIFRGQGIVSPNGKHNLELHLDGHLALYSKNVGLTWSSDVTKSASSFFMNFNGNAELYGDSENVIFSTETTDRGGHFELLDNGNMVVYDADRNVIWSSDTYQGDFVYRIFVFENKKIEN